MRTLLGYGVLLLGIILGATRLVPPAALPATAPTQSFSAARAFTDIRTIAQNPHPVSTPAHELVRAYLVGRLAQLGLAPVEHASRGVVQSFPGRVSAAPVTNIIGVLPGKDRSRPALLLSAHYDTVPNSPGAADDTAGVASLLEIARAFRAGPQPDRDIVFLFTDGEEPGLLGAEAFFDHDPLAGRIGPVINLDTRGDAGLAAMFETGDRNDGTISAYGAAVSHPSANSLSQFIYHNMPNGTDFTYAVRNGHPGINLAFIADESAYHTPVATPARLNLGSVQHMGDQALAMARAFAAATPQQHRNLVYSDVLGFFFIQYAFWVGWVIVGLAAGLTVFAIRRAARQSELSWWRGSAGALLLLLFPALLLWSAACIFDGLDHFQRLHHFDLSLTGATALTLGALGLVVATVEQGRGRLVLIGIAVAAAIAANLCGYLDWIAIAAAAALSLLAWFGIRDDARAAALWHCALVLLLVFAVLAQALAPEIAFVFAWPGLIAAVVAFTRLHLPRGHWAGVLLAIVAAVLVTAYVTALAAFLFTAVGVDMPVVFALPVFTALPALLLVPGTRRLPLWSHGALAVAGLVLLFAGRWVPPTQTHPVPSLLRFVQDLDSGKAYRVAGFSELDAWSRSALGSQIHHTPLPWREGKQWWAPVKPANVPPSSLEIRRDGARIVVTAAPSAGAYAAMLEIRAAQKPKSAELDGAKLKDNFRDGWNAVYVYVPARFRFSFPAPAHGDVEVRLLTTYLDWPADAAPPPPMPKGVMAFLTTGGTQTVQQRKLRW